VCEVEDDDMTVADERRRSVDNARKFLYTLIDPKQTPGVPKIIRTRAVLSLRHFPNEFDMEEARKLAPKIFGEWDGT